MRGDLDWGGRGGAEVWGATEEEETTQSLAKFPQNLFLLSHSI
jgi:hypothetical protein